MIAAMSSESQGYVVGEPHPNTRETAKFYTKPVSPGHTGGGYELWRSTEHRAATAGAGKEDVYVAHHRLLALVACYPIEMPIEDVLDDLRGKDVHHTSGVPWDNRPGNLKVVAHGRHSEITNSQIRAWAEDAKREAEADADQPLDSTTGEECDRCGEPDVALATSDSFDGRWCPDCVAEHREQQDALEELEDLEL